MLIEPFRIATDPLVLADLRSRLASVRLSDAVVDDWSYGTSPAALRELVARWGAYDWLAREAELNALPQYRANVDGSGVHFVHVRGVGPAPRPLLLASGWPSSFVEYLPIVNQLANPGAYGGDPRDAFHVVIPAMPGYGFSDRPVSPKAVRAVDLYKTLMTEGLGYATFAVAGSDIGTGVATRLALYYADSVSAIHICGTAPPPLERRTAPHSEAERIYLAARERWEREEGAYAAIASTRPQTLAFALADSPAGLASWIVEKFHAWSDRRERGNFWRRATRQSYALLDHGNHRLLDAALLRIQTLAATVRCERLRAGSDLRLCLTGRSRATAAARVGRAIVQRRALRRGRARRSFPGARDSADILCRVASRIS